MPLPTSPPMPRAQLSFARALPIMPLPRHVRARRRPVLNKTSMPAREKTKATPTRPPRAARSRRAADRSRSGSPAMRAGSPRRRLDDAQKAWVEVNGVKGGSRKHLPSRPPTAASPASCCGSARRAPPIRWTGRSSRSALCRRCLPPGRYHLADPPSATPSWRRSPGASAPIASAATRAAMRRDGSAAALDSPAGADGAALATSRRVGSAAT